MYGKIFASMYEGTLYGQWEALITFQQLIVLCDADGIIDMTPYAIAARTSIPLEIINKGLKVLQEPDQYSRTPDQDGRRIELIDSHRPWGWHIVNHAKYQSMQDSDMVRAQTRERVRRHRASKASVTVTDGNGQKRHTDTDTDTDTDRKALFDLQSNPALPKNNFKQQAREVLQFLNEKTGHRYRDVDTNTKPIIAKLRSGVTVQDCKIVIARKVREWKDDDKMSTYLRPKTLFGASNFESYLGQCHE